MDVLVIGGSLVGLTTAALLADHGVRCLVVERHRGMSIHPRFRGITTRTMEIYRGLDLEDAIRKQGDVEHELGIVGQAHTLADEDLVIAGAPEEEATTGISPTDIVAFDQDQLEPLLLDRARELGATVRFGTELVEFTQDGMGVTAVLRDRDTGADETMRCAYLVAADGAHSPVRKKLGIPATGPGVLGQRMSMVFRTDLTRALRGRVFFSCLIRALGGATLVRRRAGVWQLAVPYDPTAEGVADFPPERCVDLLRTATADPGLSAEVLSVLPWEVAAWIADRYEDGRVFLTGDSAHVWPPYGGLNGNTGIQDGHNLAWKLAAVLDGRAAPGLLDTYTSERRPRS
jgi:putative polyketide hydroxylase